jgi:hypothetical protein
MHHYRNDETDIFFGDGAPTASASRPSKYIDRATGAEYLNLGGGTTWYQVAGGNISGVGNAGTLLVAARTLTVADHNTDFFLGLVGGFTVTLPTAAAALRGLRFRFHVEVAPTTAYIIQTGNTAEQLLAGLVHSSTGGDADSEAAFTGTNVNFVASTAVIGDWCEVISCGATGWLAKCFCNADAGITITG